MHRGDPDLTKARFVVGGKHGSGVVSCRTASGWSAPAFITMSGGSVGFQAGAEKQDLVLLMNPQGADELKSGHWDLGAEAAAAGSSGGKEATESTGCYSNSSGAFAGADIGGSKENNESWRYRGRTKNHTDQHRHTQRSEEDPDHADLLNRVSCGSVLASPLGGISPLQKLGNHAGSLNFRPSFDHMSFVDARISAVMDCDISPGLSLRTASLSSSTVNKYRSPMARI
jgi:hypothetical protein